MKLTAAKIHHIAQMWVDGRTVDQIAAAGESRGWTRSQAAQIAVDAGWVIRNGRTHTPPTLNPVETFKSATTMPTANLDALRKRGRVGSNPRPRTATKQPLTVAEVADALRLSKMSVYRMIHAGELRAAQFGRSYRIPVDAYDEYIAKAAADGAA